MRMNVIYIEQELEYFYFVIFDCVIFNAIVKRLVKAMFCAKKSVLMLSLHVEFLCLLDTFEMQNITVGDLIWYFVEVGEFL